jgi:hypothetical protein
MFWSTGNYLIPARYQTSIPWSFCAYPIQCTDEVIPAQLKWLGIKSEFQSHLHSLFCTVFVKVAYIHVHTFVENFAALEFMLSQVVALHGNGLM